jgi:hypothetical protein
MGQARDARLWIPRVSQNRVSDNVGPCQALLSALLHALEEERYFALVEGFAFPTVGRS